MSESNEARSNTAPRSRAQIWILVGVFFAPLIIAFFLYYGMEGWRPSGSTNHGELVRPPREVPEVALTTPEGTKLPANVLRGKWTLVYIGNGVCDARCREALTLMRQTRLALHDDMSRVQRLFLVTTGCCNRQYLQTEHDGLSVGLLDEDAHELTRVFADATPEPLESSGRIYIIDPLGNLMMSHARTVEQKGLLEDLKKLLKLSHIG